MFARSARSLLRTAPSSSSLAPRALPAARAGLRRSYATARRPPPSSQSAAASSSDSGGGGGGAAQGLAVAAATLVVGGLILGQRGSVMNEASVKRAAARAGESVSETSKKAGPERDQKRVNEPVYTAEDIPKPDAARGSASSSSSSSVAPEIVTRKEAEAEQETAQAAQASGGSSQGAFNEETGEINWDCPCLGGMADGPCGEDFKAAFSCFVFSEAEPKGVDCVEKFKGMQDCFRLHPEIYGEEIEDDDEANAAASASAGGGTDGVVPPSAAAGSGEEVGAVDAPSIRAEAAQGASVGTA